MDIVTKSQFDQFKDQYNLQAMQESSAFELFVIYCVASKYVKSETISKDMLCDLSVGDGGDWGIDGLIPIVNGRIVLSQQEIDDILATNGSLSVHFVLVQAKTSESFNVALLGQTLDGAEYLLKEVLGDTELPPCNDALKDFRELFKHVYQKSADFANGINPKLSIFYVTCGEYQSQADFTSKIAKTKSYVCQTDLIAPKGFECFMLGKKELVNLYKETKSQLACDIRVDLKIPMPEVERVSEGYLCLLRFSEFRKLIIDQSGDMIDSVFNDNIRAFQGDNPVNLAMSQSLKDENLNLFTAMNNGITIIAKDMRTTGANIRLVDYQIVNGCQTSYVLHKNIGLQNIDSLQLIVKLIASNDKKIRDKIIVGNNSQTEVRREQLVSLLDAQKYIEDYYSAQNKFTKLYYERRSKQFKNSGMQVPQDKVITIPFQIKAFVSMIMSEPHKVSGYYGSIVEQFDKNGRKVFAPDIKPEFYYTSAFACYKMTECFATGFLDRKYKKMKFHMLLAFRLMCEKFSLPPLNSHKAQEYCDHLCTLLNDNERCKQGFFAAAQLVDIALGRNPVDNDRMSHNFTTKLKTLAQQANKINANKYNKA